MVQPAQVFGTQAARCLADAGSATVVSAGPVASGWPAGWEEGRRWIIG
jgi:hypothetical protein